MFGTLASLSAQNIKISGTVTDAGTGEPMAYASVAVKGLQIAAATDLDGHFTITAPGNAQLEFSFVGYTTQLIPINGRTVINATLSADATTLEDVVVVAYGVAKRESITGSVAQVNSKKLEKHVTSSVTSALEGASAGVQVNNSYGEPGSDATIRIRGFSTINGSNSPLYVLDGVVYGGNISDLNPQDIESISVLKDASSSALYGNRASNGVIIITTKRGSSTKASISANINQGVYQRGIRDYDRMGANDYMETMFQVYRNGLVSAGTSDYATSTKTAQTKLISDVLGYNIYNKADDALFDDNGKLASGAAIKSKIADDLDWWKPLERLGYRQDYNVSGNAASDKGSYFISAGYLNEKGYVITSDFQRFNARTNVSVSPRKWITAGLNLGGSYQESSNTDASSNTGYINPFYYARNMAPIYPVHAHDLTSDDGAYLLDGNGNIYYDEGTNRKQNIGRHVIWELQDNMDKTYRTTLDGQAFMTFKFLKDFAFTVKGDLNVRHSENQTYNNAVIGDGSGSNGRAARTIYRYKNYTFQQQLTWNKSICNSNFDILLGHENYSNHYNYQHAYKTNQVYSGQTTLNNFTVMTDLTDYYADYRTESYLGRIKYNYDEKYYAELSFRRDGSSRFYQKNRWGNFWSLGGTWIVTKENFMKDVSWVNSLKLRASYGQVGNDEGVGYYGYMALYSLDQNAGKGAAYKTQNEALNIQWETSSSWDLALEGRYFNMLDLNVEYFDKRSQNLLFDVQLPLSAGATSSSSATASITQNLGSIANKGVELDMNLDLIQNRNFRWSVNANATFMKNVVVKLPEQNRVDGIVSGNFKYMEGHSIYDYYVYQYAGVDQMTGRCLYLPNTEDYYIGTPTDANDTRKELDPNYLVEINGNYYTTYTTYAKKDWSGSVIPKVYGSFGTSLSWKNFTLSALFTYALGGKTYDASYASLMSASMNVSALHADLLKSWSGVPTGMTETSTDRISTTVLPGLDYYYNTYNSSMSSRWLQKGDYLVVKNISLGYELPKTLVQKIDLSGITLNLAVENLATFTSLKGMNPQQSFAGTSSNSFTTARVFSLGINIRL